jgi:hypothetical protein
MFPESRRTSRFGFFHHIVTLLDVGVCPDPHVGIRDPAPRLIAVTSAMMSPAPPTAREPEWINGLRIGKAILYVKEILGKLLS